MDKLKKLGINTIKFTLIKGKVMPDPDKEKKFTTLREEFGGTIECNLSDMEETKSALTEVIDKELKNWERSLSVPKEQTIKEVERPANKNYIKEIKGL
jgi:hypothetical protein